MPPRTKAKKTNAPAAPKPTPNGRASLLPAEPTAGAEPVALQVTITQFVGTAVVNAANGVTVNHSGSLTVLGTVSGGTPAYGVKTAIVRQDNGAVIPPPPNYQPAVVGPGNPPTWGAVIALNSDFITNRVVDVMAVVTDGSGQNAGNWVFNVTLHRA